MQPIFFKKSTRKSAKKTEYDKKSGILCYKAIFFGNKITFFNFYYYLCNVKLRKECNLLEMSVG